LKKGGLDHVLFGRNEQGNEHFHQWMHRSLSDTDSEIYLTFKKILKLITNFYYKNYKKYKTSFKIIRINNNPPMPKIVARQETLLTVI